MPSITIEKYVSVDVESDEIMRWVKANPGAIAEQGNESLRDEFGGDGMVSLTTSVRNDDAPLLKLLALYGASLIRVDAVSGLWRCRAWFGARVIEGSDASRSLAAGKCLIAWLTIATAAPRGVGEGRGR